MIDLEKEKLIGLHAVGQCLPPGRNGAPVSESCVLRWIKKGVKLPCGRRVRLEALRVGSRWCASREALQRFLDAQTPETHDPAPLPRSADQRRRASEAAAKELEATGV